MQTTNHPIPQTIAHGLASLGRYGDTYLVHAAEGETVIPAEILLANPQLKADLFRQMQMMGIKNPNRYVVGSALNSLNPVTGQPEFFFKKIFKAFKSVAPVIFAAIGERIAPGLGAIIGAAGGTKFQGGSWKDALVQLLRLMVFRHCAVDYKVIMIHKVSGEVLRQRRNDLFKQLAVCFLRAWIILWPKACLGRIFQEN